MLLSALSKLSSVFLIFTCIRFVVGGNQCTHNTYNANGERCSGVWKYDASYPWCLGHLSTSFMDQPAGVTHCSSQGGIMLAPQNQGHTDQIQAWRGSNSDNNVETWMRGQRQELTTNRCKVDCCSWKNRWEWTHYAKEWNDKSGEIPWDRYEPKSSCSIGGEKCFSMNSKGRWKDRYCTDKLRVLCEKSHVLCTRCSEVSCGTGRYRTTCADGSKADSTCADCTNNPAECPDNNHRFSCTSGTTNTCTGCRTNSPDVRCTPGNWLKEHQVNLFCTQCKYS